MDWRIAAALLPLALAGCADVGKHTAVANACIADSADITERLYPLLVRHDLPDAAAVLGRAGIAVNVTPGQTLSIDLNWHADAGLAQALFDGKNVTAPGDVGSYFRKVTVEAGIHTLEIEGAPVAESVKLSLSLVTNGCAPGTGPGS